MEPDAPDVGRGAVEDVDHLSGWVQGPVTPEENDMGPQSRVAELLVRNEFHHPLDGGVSQAVGGKAVRPPVLGVGVLVEMDMSALLVVEVEKDVPILVR